MVSDIMKKARAKEATTKTIPNPPVKNPPKIINIRLGTETSGPNPKARAILQSSVSQILKYSLPGG